MIINNYLKSFAYSLSSTINTMFSVEYVPSLNEKDELEITESKALKQAYPLTVFIPFHGTISGEYYLNTSKDDWYTILNDWVESPEELEELVTASIKELLNGVCGSAIESIKVDFPCLTIESPRLIFGKIECPEFKMFTFELTHNEYKPVYATLGLNLMHQDIGAKLEEEIEKRALEAARAQKAERTINSIMSHLDSGIFCMNLNGQIYPGCSKSLSYLLFKPLSEIEDALVTDVFPETILSNKQFFLDWLQFLETAPEEMDWDSCMHICPVDSETTFAHQGKEYVYHFEFIKIPSENELTIMVIIDDITAQKELEKELERAQNAHKSNLELLSNVLSNNNAEIFEFVERCDSMFSELLQLKNITKEQKDNIHTMFRLVHSMKGEAAMLKFTEFVKNAHIFEDYLYKIRESNDELVEPEKIESYLNTLHSQIDNIKLILSKVNVKRGEELTNEKNKLFVKTEELANVTKELINIKKLIPDKDKLNNLLKPIIDTMLNMQLIPLYKMETTLQSMIEDTARKIGKQIGFSFNSALCVKPEIFHVLSNPIIHIIRNSIDHGIEFPDIRKSKNKNAMGLIQFKTTFEEGKPVLLIEDDGAGLNPEQILKKAIENGLINEKQSKELDREEIFALIFLPGLSTKQQVSTLSGRGVGMDIVKAAIEKINGSIKIESELNKFTRFKIFLEE